MLILNQIEVKEKASLFLANPKGIRPRILQLKQKLKRGIAEPKINKNNSIKPTPLLRFSNLSSQGFSQYMKELKDNELIREEKDKKDRNYITLTDKGFKFLEKYSQIKGFVDEFGL